MTPDERRDDRVALSMIGLVSSGVVLAVGFLLVGRHPPMGAAHTVSALPLVNAWLNGTGALLLAAGYWFIRQRKVTAHKTCMVTAFGVSSCFLVSYVIYHYYITRARSPSGATGGFGGSITPCSSPTSSSPP
jgi:putative membrane protein